MSETLSSTPDGRQRAVTLTALCLAVLLVAMNASLITVALPSIRAGLQFTDSSLPWVVNAYLAAFGGALLLAGRLADIFGCRPLLLLGIVIFTLSSLSCGWSNDPGQLIAARALQGLGAALMSAVSLAQTSILFPEQAARSRALGIYVFVAASGGSAGTLLGGALINALDWHWIFRVNVLAGVAVLALCTVALPAAHRRRAEARVDVVGAGIATASLTLAIWAIVNSSRIGATSAQTLGVLAGAAALFTMFLELQRRTPMPLVALELFRDKGLDTASAVAALYAAAVTSGNFIAALYMQLALRLDPLQLGLAFLPATLGAAVMSLVTAPALVQRWGARLTLILGLLTLGAGLALLAYAPVSSRAVQIVLTSMLLMGVGSGLCYNPLFLSGLGTIAPVNAGAASGIINTCHTMGGAIGLSIVSSISASKTNDLLGSGWPMESAMTAGYRLSFATGMVFAIGAAIVALRIPRGQNSLRSQKTVSHHSRREGQRSAAE